MKRRRAFQFALQHSLLLILDQRATNSGVTRNPGARRCRMLKKRRFDGYQMRCGSATVIAFLGVLSAAAFADGPETGPDPIRPIGAISGADVPKYVWTAVPSATSYEIRVIRPDFSTQHEPPIARKPGGGERCWDITGVGKPDETFPIQRAYCTKDECTYVFNRYRYPESAQAQPQITWPFKKMRCDGKPWVYRWSVRASRSDGGESNWSRFVEFYYDESKPGSAASATPKPSAPAPVPVQNTPVTFTNDSGTTLYVYYAFVVGGGFLECKTLLGGGKLPPGGSIDFSVPGNRTGRFNFHTSPDPCPLSTQRFTTYVKGGNGSHQYIRVP
jgi:hypothetical protein